MQGAGDTRPYRRIAPHCDACTEMADRVDTIYSAGGHVQFAGSQILRLRRVGEGPPTFEVALRVPATVIHRRAGGNAERLPEGRMRTRVTVQRSGDRWTVTHYGIL